MNRVLVDRYALEENLRVISQTMADQKASWTLVTKVLCGQPAILRLLADLGVRSVGDTRLRNLRELREAMPEATRWYLCPPRISTADRIVEDAHVSLNTEIDTLRALDAAARRQGRRHSAVVMVELGELREGVLPDTLVSFMEDAFALQHVDIVGLGANLGCLSGTVPTLEQLAPLMLYSKLVELEFDRPLPVVSAGSSVLLAALEHGRLPDGINHYRIGEAAFLGTDLIQGGTLPGLRRAVSLEAEIVELKEKNLVPLGETSDEVTPFANPDLPKTAPGERGHRALVSLGQLDTDVNGLSPEDPEHVVLGASSDLTVVYLGENPGKLRVGDRIRFHPDYSALLRAMNSRDLAHEIVTSDSSADAADLGSIVASGMMVLPEKW